MNTTSLEVFRRVGWMFMALLLQVTLGPKLAILGVQPSILMTVFVMFSLNMGSLASIWTGFAIGLVLDVYLPGVPGGFSLAMAIVGYLVGLVEERRVHTEYVTRVFILGVACILHDAIWFLVGRHALHDLGPFLLRSSAPSGLYTMIVGAGIFALKPAARMERRW